MKQRLDKARVQETTPGFAQFRTRAIGHAVQLHQKKLNCP